MNQNLIYYPCFALIVLSLLVLFRMLILRVRGVRSGAVDVRYFKTYDNSQFATPPEMTQASRNFTNLFEAPVLFFVVCLFALVTKNVNFLFLSLAWCYVIFRYVHSYIHLTNNKILWRMGAYVLSWIVLGLMATQLLFVMA